MARELTVQIRMTQEEHSAIAALARREGLGVGTYLRALALRAGLQEAETPAGKAFRAVRESQARAKAHGLDEISAEDIDAEIKAARSGRRRS
jgi:hypothetical protein